MHIFERAPGGRGLMANIDRDLDVGVATPGCGIKVLVTKRYFAVSKSDELLRDLVAVLGPAERKLVPATPTVSYLPEDCALT